MLRFALQRAESLLETVRHGADAEARVAAAHQLASLLEDAEEAFKAAVGSFLLFTALQLSRRGDPLCPCQVFAYGRHLWNCYGQHATGSA